MQKPYSLTHDQIAEVYLTNPNKGLTSADAHKRLEKFGKNSLDAPKTEPLLSVFLRQFKNPLIYLLTAATIFNIFFGHYLDAFFIAVILTINALISTFQEARAHSLLASLISFMKSEAIVIRNGKEIIVEDTELAPGDLLVVQEGLKVPADARIINVEELIVDEASLTGESSGIKKIDSQLDDPHLSTFDQTNMLFKGTYILSGSGRAIVTATGKNTEIAQFQETIDSISLDIPLQKEVTHISYIILGFCAALTLILVFLSIVTGQSNTDVFFTIAALIVAIIPEGLPIMLTLTLTYGAYNMAKKRVLVKNLQAVDTLGRVDVMVLDKTGTLTKNEMMVTHIFSDGTDYTISGQGYDAHGSIFNNGKQITIAAESHLEKMAIAASLLGRAVVSYADDERKYHVKGDPTEAALLVFAQKFGFDHDTVAKKFKKIYHFPFTPETRYHAGFFEYDDTIYLFCVGSPEIILDFCVDNKPDVHVLDNYLNEGLRVVAGAYRTWQRADFKADLADTKNLSGQLQEYIKSLTFLGFFGVEDTIRDNVDTLIKQARDAGIHIIMATGDHITTASHIARKVGIFQSGDVVISGKEIEAMATHELASKLGDITVCARVTPISKVKIIDAFHQLGAIVSMTGDGVNDVPSLAAADVGIAMGIMGTDVAKNAADIVLLDDSFASVIEGMQWGKHTYYTVRRVILYLLATNLGEALLITFALLLVQKIPLTLMQILWINIVTDGFLDLALIFEPKTFNLIGKKIPKGRLMNQARIIHIFFLGLLMSLGTLIVFYYYRFQNLQYARTMALITMALFQWFNAWNNRSEEHSIFTLGLLTNKWLIGATALVAAMTVAVVHLPIFQKVFQTTALTAFDWAVAILIGSSIIIVEELLKYFKFKKI